jgi:GntR family transcriptional regulator, transcriptional repressor for pyruvate dehydrogenase complex
LPISGSCVRKARPAASATPDAVLLDHLRELIVQGSLSQGMKLPSERQLASRYRVSRGYVRKALKKLEHYGILHTRPQSGTVIAGLGGKALAGLIASIRTIDDIEDAGELMEMRAVLEVHAARMAASRGSARQLAAIRAAQAEFREVAQRGERALEEDHLFHLAIARACGNDVALSLISLLTPEIIAMNRDYTEADPSRFAFTIREHENIVRAILARNQTAAGRSMSEHMERSRQRRLPRDGETGKRRRRGRA